MLHSWRWLSHSSLSYLHNKRVPSWLSGGSRRQTLPASYRKYSPCVIRWPFPLIGQPFWGKNKTFVCRPPTFLTSQSFNQVLKWEKEAVLRSRGERTYRLIRPAAALCLISRRSCPCPLWGETRQTVLTHSRALLKPYSHAVSPLSESQHSIQWKCVWADLGTGGTTAYRGWWRVSFYRDARATITDQWKVKPKITNHTNSVMMRVTSAILLCDVIARLLARGLLWSVCAVLPAMFGMTTGIGVGYSAA